MTDLLSFFMKNAVIRKIRSNSIIQLEPAMQFVSEGDEKHEGSAALHGPGLRSCWAPAEDTAQGDVMPGSCLAVPRHLTPGYWSPWSLHIWTVTSDVQFCHVPNTVMKRSPIQCWHCAPSTNSKINWIGTNSVSPGLFLLPLMSLVLIQLLLINFHQV